jgi:hypothetical protein
MVMELPPHATHLDEPSGRADSKVDPSSGSFAEAFFASNEEMIVIVTLRCEIVECHADGSWPAKQLRIPFLDGRPSSPDTANWIVHARSITLRPVGSERFQVGGVEGPVKNRSMRPARFHHALAFPFRLFQLEATSDSPSCLVKSSGEHTRTESRGVSFY